jgi:hypothetical protein
VDVNPNQWLGNGYIHIKNRGLMYVSKESDSMNHRLRALRFRPRWVVLHSPTNLLGVPK